MQNAIMAKSNQSKDGKAFAISSLEIEILNIDVSPNAALQDVVKGDGSRMKGDHKKLHIRNRSSSLHRLS
jgi:hypothetical protein